MNTFSHIAYAAKTDVGRKRKNNEDAFGVFPDAGVFCVTDGMGGGDDGEIASAAVVKSVGSFDASCRPPRNVGYAADDMAAGVAAAMNEASAWISSRAKERKLKGCGSTFVGVCFDATSPSDALALHAGDSRLYRIRGAAIKQITKDHSPAELIGVKDESTVAPCFRGVILRAVGIHPSVDVEQTPFPIKEGDRIVICSDGLSKMVDERRISAIVQNGATPEATAEALVAAANDAGGVDNVTAVVLFVGTLPPALSAIVMPLAEAFSDSGEDTDDADTSNTGSGGGCGPDTDTEEEPETIVTAAPAEPTCPSWTKIRRVRVLRRAGMALGIASFLAVAAVCGFHVLRVNHVRKAEIRAGRERNAQVLAEATRPATANAGAVVDGCRATAAQTESNANSIVSAIEQAVDCRQSGMDDAPPDDQPVQNETVAVLSEGDAWEAQVLPRLVVSCAATNAALLVKTIRRFPVKDGVEMLPMRCRPLCDEKLPVTRRQTIAADITADMQDVSRALRRCAKRRLGEIDAALAEHTTRAEFKDRLAAERGGIAAFMAATEKFVGMEASSAAAQMQCAEIMLGVADWLRQVN